MTRLNVNGARCAAVFASGLQRSDAPSPAAVAEVISRTVRRLGIAGCASQMAQEFGDHPEAAVSRMRWIRQLISQTPAAAAAQPARTARIGQPAGPGQRPARPSGWLSGPGSDVRATHPTTDRAHRAALPSGIGAPAMLAPARRDHNDGASSWLRPRPAPNNRGNPRASQITTTTASSLNR